MVLTSVCTVARCLVVKLSEHLYVWLISALFSQDPKRVVALGGEVNEMRDGEVNMFFLQLRSPPVRTEWQSACNGTWSRGTPVFMCCFEI